MHLIHLTTAQPRIAAHSLAKLIRSHAKAGPLAGPGRRGQAVTYRGVILGRRHRAARTLASLGLRRRHPFKRAETEEKIQSAISKQLASVPLGAMTERVGCIRLVVSRPRPEEAGLQ